jgi:DNA-binding transcriptional MerR regulator
MTDFSAREVAKKLDVTPQTVVNWIEAGLLQARRKGPKVNSPYSVTEENLAQFLKDNPGMAINTGNE